MNVSFKKCQPKVCGEISSKVESHVEQSKRTKERRTQKTPHAEVFSGWEAQTPLQDRTEAGPNSSESGFP